MRKLGIFLLFTLNVWAEVQQAPAYPPGYNPNQGYQPKPNGVSPNSLKVFSDDFFDSKPQPVAPQARSGYEAPEANYNYVQKESAVKRCDKYRELDQRKFKACVDSDLAGQLKPIQDRADKVEQELAIPLKKAKNPFLEEQEKRIPNKDDEE